MTLVTIDIHYIHLGKDQGASGRHLDYLHRLLELLRVVSAWFPLVQWAKMGAYHCIFSHFSLISQARKVKLRHFKSIQPST